MSAVLAGAPRWEDAEPATTAFYRNVLLTLAGDGVPFLVGGAFAFAALTGIRRDTKDLDLFIRREDYPRVETLLGQAGYRTELTFPHWLAKSHCGDAFVDLIFNTGNGVMPVDDGWFEHADDAEILGLPVKMAPPEESLCSKAFIMERERYDGADVAHLLRACASRLDWQRLRRLFGPHWRVLLSHLVLFGYIYPGERAHVPTELMEELLELLRQEMHEPPPPLPLCAGTLLSREQYLPDIEEQGLIDARSTGMSQMTTQDVARWTGAIPGRQPAAHTALDRVSDAPGSAVCRSEGTAADRSVAMPDDRKRKSSDPSATKSAGRSSDARVDTADADMLAGGAGAATGHTDLGGIPSTADTALSPSMSGSSDITSDGPLDRERPTGADQTRPAPAGADAPSPEGARRQSPRDAQRDRVGDEGPLESLGRAVSAPVRQTANPSEDEKPR
jgi:hypothetical protein